MPECHSTNSIASELSQMTDCAEGTVVITDNQTAGRGQKGSLWMTSPGQNLTFSVVLKPSFLMPKDQFLLSMAISLGVMDYLKSELGSKQVKVKWPNDVLVESKKISGVLIENHIQGNSFDSSIVGIGLNVNQTTFGDITATSLRLEGGCEYNLPLSFTNLLSKLESRYLHLKKGKVDMLRMEYIDALFGVNEGRFFWTGNTRFEGVITGVDDFGCLKVDSALEQKKFSAKEIRV